MSSTIQTAAANQRLPTADFLRGIAILGVIGCHAAEFFPSQSSVIDSVLGFGQIGVELFYFISAFTMCYMWHRREGEAHPVRSFYIRRFLRIAPLFWLAIPLYIYLNGRGASYWAPEGIGARQIFLTATFLHGFWPDSINSVVPGGWSIAVEMTFYALFPLIITTVGDRRRVYFYLAIALSIFNVLIFRSFATSFLAAHYVTASTTIVKDFLFLNFVNQSPIFLLGCYLYFCLSVGGVGIQELVVLGTWVLVRAFLRHFLGTDGFGFLLIYIALGSFFYVCMKHAVRFRLVELLGRNSYAIYLVHFLLICLLQKILPVRNSLPVLLLGFALTTLASLSASIIIHELIEKRVQRLVSKLVRPRAIHGHSSQQLNGG